jgi:hypothetical protein
MVSGETSYASGNPISLRALYNNTGSVLRTLYVDSVDGVDPRVENPTPEQWFNPAAFVNPPDFSLGTVSRSHPNLRNPSRQNHDVSVTKRFSLASDRAIEFIGTRSTSLITPIESARLRYRVSGRPKCQRGPDHRFGRGRVIQLGLRLSF